MSKTHITTEGIPYLRPVVGWPSRKVEPQDLFLELFHGRTDPDQEMDDWGSQGPVFGPFDWVHTTYSNTLRLGIPSQFHEWFLTVDKDMVFYDGLWYGDYSIFSGHAFLADSGLLGRHQPVDMDKARPPAKDVSSYQIEEQSARLGGIETVLYGFSHEDIMVYVDGTPEDDQRRRQLAAFLADLLAGPRASEQFHNQPQWVRTRGLDAETVLEIATGLPARFWKYFLGADGEGTDHQAATEYLLERVAEFQQLHRHTNWDEHGDYWGAVDAWCTKIMRDLAMERFKSVHGDS